MKYSTTVVFSRGCIILLLGSYFGLVSHSLAAFSQEMRYESEFLVFCGAVAWWLVVFDWAELLSMLLTKKERKTTVILCSLLISLRLGKALTALLA